MALLSIGGAMVQAGGGFRSDPVDEVTPIARTIGTVFIAGGVYAQECELGVELSGYTWRVGFESGPWSEFPSGENVLVDLGPANGNRESLAVAFLANEHGAQTPAIPLRLTFPGGSVPDAPSVIGAIGPVQVNVGAGVSFNLNTIIAGANLRWSCSEPYSLTAGGILTVDTSIAVVIPQVTVMGSDDYGRFASVSFPVRIDALPPAFVTELQDIVAIVGDTIEVDVAGVTTGSGRTYSASTGWGFIAGRLQVPTTEPLEIIPVTVTVTDSLGRTAQDTFNITVNAGSIPVAPTLIGSVVDVVCTLGDVVVIDVGAIVTPRTGLTWTTNRPLVGPVDTAGKVALVTTSLRGATNVRITATDSLDRLVQVEFDFSVIAAAGGTLANATLPTFTPATVPGTALGSLWNSAGDVWSGGVTPYTIVSSFLRDGAQIAGAAGTGRAYAIAAADKAGPGNKSISNQVRCTDSSVPPQVVIVNATGTATIPATVGPDFTVGNVGDLIDAINELLTETGPVTIALSPGDYGDFTLANKVKAGSPAGGPRSAAKWRDQGVLRNLDNRITIISAVKDSPARWFRTQWDLSRLNGFTFDNIRFEDDSDDGLGFAQLGKQAINCDNLANVTFRNCAWDGWCDNLAITRSDWLTIEWNDQKGAGRDSVRLFDYQNELLVQHNDFDGFRGDGTPGVDYTRSQSDDPNRHADFLSIQISIIDTFNPDGSLKKQGARGGVNLAILNNKFRSGNGYHQGFFFANSVLQRDGGDFDTYKSTNLTADGNWIETCHVNNTYIAGVENFVLKNHLIRRIPTPAGGFWSTAQLGQPTLVFSALAKGTVTDVVSHRAIKLDARMPNLNGVTQVRYEIDNTSTVEPATLPVPPLVGRFGYEGAAAPEALSVAVTPTTGVAQTTFTGSSTTEGASGILDDWFRNGALQGAAGNVYTGGAGQLGRVEYRVRAVNAAGTESDPLSAYAQMGLDQPWYHGQTIINDVQAVGGANFKVPIPGTAKLGDVAVVVIEEPDSGANANKTAPFDIVWNADFTQIDEQVVPFVSVPQRTQNDYRMSVAISRKLLQADLDLGTFNLDQHVGFHGMLIANYYGAEGPNGEGAGNEIEVNWTIDDQVRGQQIQSLDMFTRAISNCELIIAIAGSHYSDWNITVPAPNAGTSDYRPSIRKALASAPNGREQGLECWTRLTGGGTLGGRLWTFGVAANVESFTMLTIEVRVTAA